MDLESSFTRQASKKYRLDLDDSRIEEGYTLHRIVALRDFGDVKEGEKGGYIQSEDNLSHEGNSWVGDHSLVYNSAKITGDARIQQNACITCDVKVSGNAIVSGDARASGNACITGNAIVFGNAIIDGDACIKDNVRISRNAKVSGNATISGDAIISDDARIAENAKVSGNAWVAGYAEVGGCTDLSDNTKEFGNYHAPSARDWQAPSCYTSTKNYTSELDHVIQRGHQHMRDYLLRSQADLLKSLKQKSDDEHRKKMEQRKRDAAESEYHDRALREVIKCRRDGFNSFW